MMSEKVMDQLIHQTKHPIRVQDIPYYLTTTNKIKVIHGVEIIIQF
jgi:uncharacterized protein YaiL (DUF2058 family)